MGAGAVEGNGMDEDEGRQARTAATTKNNGGDDDIIPLDVLAGIFHLSGFGAFGQTLYLAAPHSALERVRTNPSLVLH